MTAAPSIKSQLRSAISDVQSKSAEVAQGTYSQDVAADRAAQAHSVTKVKENLIAARQQELDNVLEQLAPPPTKEVDAGGKNGGTKTVVDKDEVESLTHQKGEIMKKIRLAKEQAEEARTEAATATTEALTAANVTQDAQSEMAALMSQINSINDALSQGQDVSDDEITGVIDKFKQISEGFGKDDNVSGAISKAFYNPVKDGMQRMLDHLNSPRTSTETNDSSNSDDLAHVQNPTQDQIDDATSSDQASGSSDTTDSTDNSSDSSDQAVTPVSSGAAAD